MVAVLSSSIIFAQKADIIITNANIITAVQKGDRQQALAIKDGNILFVGSYTAVLQYKQKNTKMIDAKGNTIIPGLNDAHLHPSPETPFSQLDHTLRLDTVTSMGSLIALLAKKAAITPKGMLIKGRGYNEAKLGSEPTTEFLDKASTAHPILITHASGHKSAANSTLLAINHITKNTQDPAGGAFDRYADGSPNGICKEAASRNLTNNPQIVPYPVLTKAQELANYQQYFSHLLSFGITSIGDAGADTNRLKIYQTLANENFPMRFNVMIVDKLLPEMEGGDAHHETDEWKALSYFDTHTIPQIETDGLRVKSIKVFHGNSLSGKTCWLYEPYNMPNPATGKMDYYGIPYKRTQQQLDSLFLAIHRKGLQICVHSNGDREIDMVLNAFEKVYATGNPLNLHHRIEHCSIVNDSIIARIKKLGVIPVLHDYINELGDLLEPYGADRLNRMFATKSFLDAGILPALHSDAPVSNYDARARWESAVLRTTASGKQLGAKQCIDAEDALIMFTKGGANATGELAKKGTLEKGKLADFVIIQEDPTTIPANQIHNLHILQTWVGGVKAFSK
jgi:predicted amidohydrolase YtcJ